MKIKQAIIVLFLLMVLFYLPSAAAEQSDARVKLETTLNELLDILAKPEFKTEPKNGPLMEQVKNKIYGICDFEEFAARTVGGHWRSFTPEQRKGLIDAFGELLFDTYSDKLVEYNGQKINFTGEITGAKGDKVEIQTTIPYQGKEAPVNYRMIKKPEGWKVYDIIIENVGLVQNYRNQFQDILNKQSPDVLIQTVRNKAGEAGEKNNAPK